MSEKKVSYQIGEDGEFIVRNYNIARPFSGFFPGIAGLFGKPMWAFFVNRAQCLCSMGTENKDGAILEFQSANRAYTLTNTQGFRTFLKIYKDGAFYFYEPFIENTQYEKENLMSIGSADLYIEEKNYTLGIDISVRYFCIPGEPFSALARQVILKNNNNNPISIELLDGLAFILPYGLTERLTKDMSHTIQAWMHVVNLEKNIPLYKLKVVIADKPIVREVTEGNFYLSYHYLQDDSPEIIKPIVDPGLVFGPTIDLRSPYRFFLQGQFDMPIEQREEGITPSALSFLRFELGGQSNKEFRTLVGRIDLEILNNIQGQILNKEYFSEKLKENRKYIKELQDNMLTESSSREFNLYCGNTFLDNVLRGGYPVTLLNYKKPVVLHLYSRRHGDVERDYNKFLLQSTYYSQGDGNYRDVCQNRRNDQWFNPDVYSDNIKTFVNLIQLDGYNPLQIKMDRFIVKKVPKELDKIKEFLKNPFTIGELLNFIEKNKIKLNFNREGLVKFVVSISQKDKEAEYKEGYWIDHWTYIADLLESYRSLYPDHYWNIFKQNDYTFYDSPAVVASKKERIVIESGKIRQYHSVIEDRKKEELIASRKTQPNKIRTRYGYGKVYRTTLLVKLLCVIANKYASIDPFGIGIEMEADRPGWYDALNGLPGLFGSSTCETFELKRLVILVMEVLEHLNLSEVILPIELANYLEGLFRDINKKEKYRKETKFGISGKEKGLSIIILKNGLRKILNDLNKAINKAYNPKTGLYHTYFINEVVSIKPLRYKKRTLPPFLESQVHALRLVPGHKNAKSIYNAVRKNGLYDEKLKMYKVNASLKNEPVEIGRVKVFSPGWLENESIWVHMEYKYLLELLRNGLYEEFYNDFKNVIIPFQNPEIYGRNVLENCSFIVSSAHPDNSLHGVGFLPRLTGATAEFIHMWLWMCIGKEPFFVNPEGKLNMRFKPILSNWLFTEEATFGFNLLRDIKVVYHNPEKKDTFGKDSVRPFKIMFENISIDGDTVPAPYAEQIRQRKIKRIDIYLG